MITVNSYFSGAGGLDLGLSLAGLTIQQSLDYDVDSCTTLRNNFSHSVINTDIRNKTVLDQIKSDVIAGTYPCNHYSNIASIHNSKVGDDLFLHFFRHLALIQPEAYIIENVPGMKKFPVVMEAMSKLPNYYVNIFCPLDANLWLPQNRKRLILIGTKRPFFIMNPSNSRRIRLKDIVERNPDIEVPEYVRSRITGEYRDTPIISDPDKDELAPTCVARIWCLFSFKSELTLTYGKRNSKRKQNRRGGNLHLY